jgi:hypothetical protein
MDLLQTWLVIGIPGLAIAGGLFVGRSAFRALLGFAALVVLIVVFLTVPEDTISAAAIGMGGVILLAVGRGTPVDDQHYEHHEQRRRFTTTASDTAQAHAGDSHTADAG